MVERVGLVVFFPQFFTYLGSVFAEEVLRSKACMRAFSPRMGHGLLEGLLKSVSAEQRHLGVHEQLVGNQVEVMVVISGFYSLTSGRTKVPRTARWSDGYPVMAMSVFVFVSSIPTVTASMAVTPVPQ